MASVRDLPSLFLRLVGFVYSTIMKLTCLLSVHYINNFHYFAQGYVQHDGNGQQAFAEGRQISVFEVLNQKLLAFGIPRFTFGQFVFEPIVSVGFLLAGLLFGISGLLFAGLLYFVVRWSQTGGGFSRLGGQQHGAPPGNDGNPPGAGRRGGGGTFGGGSEGYRLGRS